MNGGTVRLDRLKKTDKLMKARLFRNVHAIIRKNNLDLTGLSILTEAASGNYSYTPIIAACANATKVYALAKDSRYGKREDVVARIANLAGEFGVEDRIVFVTEDDLAVVGKADIITNSGHLRPLDREKLKRAKDTAVISLMYEPWEFRATDLDLEYCRERGIPVLGVNETDPPLNLFEANGFLISKILLDHGFEIFKNSFLIIGSGKIATSIQAFFSLNRIENRRITLVPQESDSVSTFYLEVPDANSVQSDYDAIILCEHHDPRTLIGTDGLINKSNIKKYAETSVIHVCGTVDRAFVNDEGLLLIPENYLDFGYMSFHADYLGPLMTIELTTAGIKVGEIMARHRLAGKTYAETIAESLKDSLVMGF